MKNTIIIILTTLVISSCLRKECNDSNAVNYNQKGDCLFCTTNTTTETITVEVFDTKVNGPFYGQNIADVIFERKFTAYEGGGCTYQYGATNLPICEINYKVKNKTSKRISITFSIEYLFNGIYQTTVFSNNGNYIEPNAETNSTVFSNSICTNLKDATIKATPYSDTYYN